MERVYDTDLTDEPWSKMEALPGKPDPQKGGGPREYSLRSIFNAIFYIQKTGCPWRMLPKDFPKWGRDDRRQPVGQDGTKRGASADRMRGFDGGKRVKGRKPHLLTDTLGLLWARQVSAAKVSDAEGLRGAILSVLCYLSRLVRV